MQHQLVSTISDEVHLNRGRLLSLTHHHQHLATVTQVVPNMMSVYVCVLRTCVRACVCVRVRVCVCVRV